MPVGAQSSRSNQSGWIAVWSGIAVSLGMLFVRQRLLLTLLDAIGEAVGDKNFQSLLFLYTQEGEEAPSYEFVPGKSGAFSFTSGADKQKLIEAGLLAEDDQNWKLTKAGRAEARRKAVEPLRVAEFCRQHSGRRGRTLIAEQCRRFPSDALFAEFECESLPRQGAALETIRAWVRAGERVALTCFERLPEQCHRHCVAEALVRMGGRKLKPQHL